MKIYREWAMPNRNTFTIKPIYELLQRYIKNTDVIIDPFANTSKIANITNDMNPSFDTNYNLDALEFLTIMDNNSADIILFDPPYSFTQAKECYDGYGSELLSHDKIPTKMDYWASCKKEVARILKPSGICISFGWHSNGVGIINGCEIIEILLVAHGGSQNDTIVTVDRKIQQTLDF